MKKLLVLLIAACFCIAPAVAHAGNLNPTLYLEMYMYDTDPDDPDYGCVIGGTCPEICYHSVHPLVGDLHCYNTKTAYFIGVTPIHVAKLATPPLADGWPLPCGPGGGYVLVSCAITKAGAAVTFMGLTVCPNFLQGPGTAPGGILVSATTKCHDWEDHPCYGKWLTTNVVQTNFTITGNLEDGNMIDLINCQGTTERPILTVSGGAQWGGTKTIVCATNPTAVTTTTWGAIKGLYR